MAPQTSSKPKKRRHNRKARTEVSSDDSSSSKSENAISPPPKQSAAQASSPPAEGVPRVAHVYAKVNGQQRFEDFYLQQATKEFANDLDKLRNASDFRGGQSVDLLVRALKQGQACFGAEEREKNIKTACLPADVAAGLGVTGDVPKPPLK